MNGDLKNLEQAIERDMALLRDLPPVAPRPETVARVQAAVRRAAVQRPQPHRFAWLYRTGLGVAAAAALTLAFWPHQPAASQRMTPAVDPDTTVQEWTAAFDASDLRWSRLMDSSAPTDASEDVDDLLRGLDQSLNDFGAL